MTKSQGRIPRTIIKFHPYIANTTAYITANGNANGTRLGLTASEIMQWTAFNTIDAQNYATWSNKKLRNSDVISNLKVNINNCHAYDKFYKLLDRIAASPAVTILDMETFNIHKGVLQDKTATHHTTVILDMVDVTIEHLSGGRVRYLCRPEETSKKAHIPSGADTIEVRAKVGAPAPAGANSTDAQWTLVSSKAIAVHDFTTENVGKTAYLFFRWADSKHPQRNGSWSEMRTIVIS